MAKQHLRAGTVCTASSLKRSENKAAYEVTTRVDQDMVHKQGACEFRRLKKGSEFNTRLGLGLGGNKNSPKNRQF